jgi:hypothetical protein
LRKLVDTEPGINIASKSWLDNQYYMWKTLQLHLHENADAYLSEMEATDKVGPGMLEFAPKLDIPVYARYEIHIQPGGYVGDPFAGHTYHTVPTASIRALRTARTIRTRRASALRSVCRYRRMARFAAFSTWGAASVS